MEHDSGFVAGRGEKKLAEMVPPSFGMCGRRGIGKHSREWKHKTSSLWRGGYGNVHFWYN